MFLKRLTLTNFRNYPKLDFVFDSKITLLYGDNAQGKTNFLESILYLASGKTPRVDKDEQLILAGEEFLRVEGEVILGESDKEGETKLEIALALVDGSMKKRLKVNGVPRRVVDYVANLAAVMFSPEDINLLTGSPSLRRDFLDQAMSQVDREYKKALSQYEDIVTSKNKVLKRINEGLAQKDELDFWLDRQLELGVIIQQKRTNFFDFINNQERQFGTFSYIYTPNLISKERLNEYQEKEILSCNSLVGPHRDDFLFMLGERNLSLFGSRGEQRTAVLDLKTSQLLFMEHILGSRPVLILDDIFSELDQSHRTHVLDLASRQQTIISTVELEDDVRAKLQKAKLVKIKQGAVIF